SGRVTNSEYAYGLGAGIGAVYLYGLAARDIKLQETILLVIEASAINSISTIGLKYIFGRPRPYQTDYDRDDFYPFSGLNGFPSGHTSSAFTVAQVVSRQYPTRWVKIPAYTLAALLGFQRIYSASHGAGDVFASAMLGMWVGDTICNLDKAWKNDDILVFSNGFRIKF
ncbi:MAG: phosphatase PAP2 family protein, partial [Candidatus Desantisbacteria bacterium]